MSTESDTPDTPPEVLDRQNKSRALTPQTAELIGSKQYVDDGGKMVDMQARQAEEKAAVKLARSRAEEFAGAEPLRGIPETRIAAVKAKTWAGAPKQESELGYRTPAFVNWIWANHPKEAVILYAYRDIWPTVLPDVWPPKQAATPKGKAKPATVTA